MADAYTFHSSETPQDRDFEFTSRQFAWVNDMNGTSYPSGQIIFDLAGISNSGKYIDWQQTNLVIPLVLNVNATTGSFPLPTLASSQENVFAASLKGMQHLFNSMSVEITNNQVVNLTNFSNLDINFRLLSSSSTDDVANFHPTINFAKDTAETIGMCNTAMAANPTFPYGIGECNNRVTGTNFNPTNGWSGISSLQNTGRLRRMISTSYDPTLTNTLNTAYFTNSNNCNTVGKSTCTVTDKNITYNILATVPLRMLHDLFRKLPLTKGMYVRLVINTNTACSVNVALNPIANGAAVVGTGSALAPQYPYGNPAVLASQSYAPLTTYQISSQTGVIPFQLSPVGVGNGFNIGTATAITASLGIAKIYGAGACATLPTINSCRMYCALYEMTPSYEERYLSSHPIKKVNYNDILCFQTMGLAPSGQLNQILSNGISRPRYLLGIPMLSAATQYAGVSVPSMSSPFSSSPTTTAPQARISQFQVLLSGSTLYQEPYTFGFQHFLQEVRQCNALNGGLELGLNSGMLSQADWENGYGFIFCDLSRKSSQANDDISRSIQVVGINSSQYAMDIMWFVSYAREINISTSTGTLVI